MRKWVYTFGDGRAEGGAADRNLLGGKGAGLAEMCQLGLPVPPGFTISTECCAQYDAAGKTFPADLPDQVLEGMAHVESVMRARFGAPSGPLLLVSVRSGARASMPGMMDTVLNLGLNEATVANLARTSGDERFAWDSYRRFLAMYGGVVLGVPGEHFERALAERKRAAGAAEDVELRAADWRALAAEFQAIVRQHACQPVPADPAEQLWGAIGAVFSSWMNKRAITYRKLHGIPDHWGTAVNVQAMVFGNLGEDCATGVCFTRDPSTGENRFFGEYLSNAQGEDVVAGVRTPLPLSSSARRADGTGGARAGGGASLQEVMPRAWSELVEIRGRLERHFRDMQDIEFTIQQGKLWILQTRTGKRTARAALRIAVDLCNEGLIGKPDAVKRVEPAQIDQLLHPQLDPHAPRRPLARGLPASPGAATGAIVLDAEEAERAAAEGRAVILVRHETSPEDIHGMHAARGILTIRGGMTSHAAVVARGMGKPCVCGAGGLTLDEAARTLRADGLVLKAGETITLDGATGEVLLGDVPKVQPELSGDFGTLMEWADEFRQLRVRANAETPQDARTARRFGAEGIGLCRTEHMFFDPERIVHVRAMILAPDAGARRAALERLLPFQRADFVELFRIMDDLPVTVRLLDPPLHEFLPGPDEDVEEIARALSTDAAHVRARALALHESNPMLGHRGCRLGVTNPEIYEMQCRAIFEAAAEATAEGVKPRVEVMLPLVATKAEMHLLRALVDRVAEEIRARTGTRLRYAVGTMIELPRAALIADRLAEEAEFFSFGTNDLTQTTFGLSRDDSSTFLPTYIDQGLLNADPFRTLDIEGVGELVKIAVERGRKARADLHVGICGEHGGDPASVIFCHQIGLDYVSCSPWRVPVARLAAAHAALGAGPVSSTA